jgi:hypothetical protein
LARAAFTPGYERQRIGDMFQIEFERRSLAVGLRQHLAVLSQLEQTLGSLTLG